MIVAALVPCPQNYAFCRCHLPFSAADFLLETNGAGLNTLPKPAPTWSLELGLYWRRIAYLSNRMELFREQIIQAFKSRRVKLDTRK